MKSLLHIPLERYKERYTENLVDWEREAFSTAFNYQAIMPPDSESVTMIKAGRVLDTTNRPIFCFKQITELLKGVRGDEIMYFSDFYTPGLDALAYAGIPNPKAAFLWAQSFDRFDFTRDMVNWMRPWEIMAFEIYDAVFVASSLLKDLIVTALPHVEGKVHVVGLPFDSKNIDRVIRASTDPLPEEPFDVVYSSRWDHEKNPGFFLDVVEACPAIKFVVCTGADSLRGTDQVSIHRAHRMAEKNGTNLTIRAELTKAAYYSYLTQTKAQFNCASQDWVSFTLLEALAAGCKPCYPMHRSFLEALDYCPASLYKPGSVEDAAFCLHENLIEEGRPEVLDKVLDNHDETLTRITNVLNSL